MLKAFAGVAAAGLALVALPATGSAVRSAGQVGSAVDAPVAAADLVGPLGQASLFGMSLGVVLWLSVAVFSLLLATVAIRRTRSVGTRVTQLDSRAAHGVVARQRVTR